VLHRVLSHEEATVSTVGAAENYMTPSLGLGIDIVSLLEVEQEGGAKDPKWMHKHNSLFF
jgi:hypothetical protein